MQKNHAIFSLGPFFSPSYLAAPVSNVLACSGTLLMSSSGLATTWRSSASAGVSTSGPKKKKKLACQPAMSSSRVARFGLFKAKKYIWAFFPLVDLEIFYTY